MLHFTNIKSYIRNNRYIYIGVFFLYLAGFVVGSLYSNLLSADSFQNTLQSTNEFIKSLISSESAISFTGLISTDLTPFVIIFFFGLFLPGIPVIIYFIFKAGFSLGFYISFMIKAFALKGLFYGLFFLVVHLIFVLPALTALSVYAIDINHYILASVNKKFAIQRNFKTAIGIYILLFLICLLPVAAGTFLKSLFLPNLVSYLFN